jgi:hypothetical protein
VRFASVLCALSCLVLFLVLSRGTRRVGAPPFERCARSAQGPSFRSGLFCPGPSSLIGPIRPTRRHNPISPLSGLYRLPSLCVGTPLCDARQPTSCSVLSRAVLCRHVVLWDPGKFLGCYHPVPSPGDWKCRDPPLRSKASVVIAATARRTGQADFPHEMFSTT